VVIETAGSEDALHRAVELARVGGLVVHLGLYDQGTSWPMDAAFAKEVGLRPSLGYCSRRGRSDFAEAADLLSARTELAEILITHRFAIEDAVQAFPDRTGQIQGRVSRYRRALAPPRLRRDGRVHPRVLAVVRPPPNEFGRRLTRSVEAALMARSTRTSSPPMQSRPAGGLPASRQPK
jgi:hypothetical protein